MSVPVEGLGAEDTLAFRSLLRCHQLRKLMEVSTRIVIMQIGKVVYPKTVKKEVVQ